MLAAQFDFFRQGTLKVVLIRCGSANVYSQKSIASSGVPRWTHTISYKDPPASKVPTIYLMFSFIFWSARLVLFMLVTPIKF